MPLYADSTSSDSWNRPNPSEGPVKRLLLLVYLTMYPLWLGACVNYQVRQPLYSTSISIAYGGYDAEMWLRYLDGVEPG